MMRCSRLTLALPLLLLAAGNARADSAGAPLTGRVLGSEGALSGALVIAYDPGRLISFPVLTGDEGSFELPSVPAGIYRIIALKKGFRAAGIRRLHSGSGDTPILLKMQPAGTEDAETGRGNPTISQEDIWNIRASVTPDVLRQIDALFVPERGQESGIGRPGAIAGLPGSGASSVQSLLRGQVSAMTGPTAHDSNSPGNQSETQLGLGGDLPGGGRWNLGAGFGKRRTIDSIGTSQAEVTVDVETEKSSRLHWKSRQNEFDDDRGAGERIKQDRFESHQVVLEKAGDEGGNASFAARLIEENHFGNEGTAAYSGRLVEIGAGFSTARLDQTGWGGAVRLRQEQFDDSGLGPESRSGNDPARTADVSLSGRSRFARNWILDFDTSSNLGVEGIDATPRIGLAWRVGGSAELRLALRGRIRMRDSEEGRPGLPVFSEDDGILDRSERRSVILTLSSPRVFDSGQTPSSIYSYDIEIRYRTLDRDARLFLGTGPGGRFDEVVLPAGTVIREARISGGRRLGPFQAEANLSYRKTESPAEGIAPTLGGFGRASVRALYLPSGTEFLIVQDWRKNAIASKGGPADLDRTEIRLGQQLPIPKSWPTAIKLLLQGEIAKGDRASFDLSGEGTASDRRWMGGVSLEF